MPVRALALLVLACAPCLVAQGSVQFVRTLEVDSTYYKTFWVDTGEAETSVSFRVNVDTTAPGGLTARLIDLSRYVYLEAASEIVAMSTAAGPLNVALDLPARAGRHQVIMIVKTTDDPASAPADIELDVSVTAGTLKVGYGEFRERSFTGMRIVLYQIAEFNVEFDAALVNTPLMLYAWSYTKSKHVLFAANMQTESLALFRVTDQNGTDVIYAEPELAQGVVRQSVEIMEGLNWISVQRPHGRPAARFKGEFIFAPGNDVRLGPIQWGYGCACCSVSARSSGVARTAALAGIVGLWASRRRRPEKSG